jgi:poly-gamma-glutamate synthesis protein (capsule biosynthesis protein)
MPNDRAGFTLALTGDVMLGRLVAKAILQRGFTYPWGDMLPVLQRADLLCINLECALTRNTERWGGDPRKPFFFRAEPSAVDTLHAARVRFAGLANNHIIDFGTEGLLETVAVLDRAGIAHAGAGPDLVTARAPAILAVGGWRVAIVAFADYPEAWCATHTAPGMCFTPISLGVEDFDVVATALTRARSLADLVIFCIHWGPNMRLRPTPAFIAFAHRVMEAGADVFWGHSAHVFQGVEIVDGRPIFYDTGDFVDDYAVDPVLRNDFSALVLMRVVPPVVERIELLPVLIDRMQVNRAIGGVRELVVDRLRVLCDEMGTAVIDGPDGVVLEAR